MDSDAEMEHEIVEMHDDDNDGDFEDTNAEQEHEGEAEVDGDVDVDVDVDMEDDDEEDEEEEDEYTPQVQVKIKGKQVKVKKVKNSNLVRRGRPPKNKKPSAPSTPVTEIINDLEVKVREDEIVTPEDPAGEEKIDYLGYLKGGRQFRVKTFKVPHRGERLYAISTDVARSIGYRDSYFLFQKHGNLFRVRLNEPDKMELIRQGWLPSQFKTRQAYLVTAKSMYKEFGARMILHGKQITDDYYEQAARDAGAIEGAPVGMNTEAYTGVAVPDRQRSVAMVMSTNTVADNEVSWIHDHALNARQFDSMLLYDRQEMLRGKQRDVYTGLNFVPNNTQPTHSQWKKISGNVDGDKMFIDTIIVDTAGRKTGLADVPLELFADCVDEETKKAILAQQQLEKI
ncbi:Npl6 protein [Martiniozyma asiatica (nom. inval.)]|nr:Npl6 protein [Martiniozyma asiatica]